MSKRLVDNELLARKRELRTRIGRSRRRIDSRFRVAQDSMRQLTSWRTYVVRYPALALAAAVGLGLAASAGLKPRRMSRRLGLSLVRHAFGGLRRQFWAELQRIWTDTTPNR
jgi:hypothetical protein